MPVLYTFNIHTELEMSSFVRSKDMAYRTQNVEIGSRDPDRAHLGDSQPSQGLSLILYAAN